MANDRESFPQPASAGAAENISNQQNEGFNELSELSLEERIAAADKMGIPVSGVNIPDRPDSDTGLEDETDEETDSTEEENSQEA